MTRTDLKAGIARGWLCESARPVVLEWEAGRVTRIQEAAPLPSDKHWLAPPLLDLQINGYAGVDFQSEHLNEADLTKAATQLSAAACSQFLVTLVTDEWEKMLGRLERLRQLRARSPRLKSAIAGWHLEGPFLSDKPGFAGAHNPGVMRDARVEDIRQLRAVAGDDAVLLTLAPERKGALEVIALAVSLGMRVSLGHTDASADCLHSAVAAGARGFTHLANACPQLLDRHDNILWRVLDTPGLTVSLIPDQIHVSPALFRLVHRVLPRSSIYYTTDAVAPAGAPPGRYRVGRFEVEVGPDQIVRHPGQTNYAGSALQPIEGVWRAARMLGWPWQQTWGGLANQPRRFMGWMHEFAPGQPANFCAIELDAAGQPAVVHTIVEGEELP